MDRIILDGIEVYAWGGVSDAERETGQRYRIHLELECDLQRAAETDDIESTIHYGRVVFVAIDALRERPFQLIEAAAARIVGALLTEFTADAVTVRLEKLLPPIDGVVASAAVEMRRERANQ